MVPGYAAKIVDETGNEVQQGEEGRLLIQGDSTCKYYWNNSEKTTATIVDGWLNTGDTYHQDDDGYFIYGGRSDDMMKVGGIWCSPFEIEAKLVEHPKVLEAAVVGRKDESGLIKPEAHVVLKDITDATEETSGELLQHCSRLTNIRAGFNSHRSCRKPPPVKSNVSNFAQIDPGSLALTRR